MISDAKAFAAAHTIVEFCKEQKGCQNCIFRKYAPDHWECEIQAFDLRNVLDNAAAKRNNHGYV